ncbi:hypothetical protein DPMN_099609 [Dreissena polymorpha]|uniref:Uncharacterized protein n=1 Tax=Dreissena polymorpha TaxID=45954 RepID=A0A9D4R7T9_DREPO|nr:hypothetical protein DPMN_099609 [Dreissena polymorpha]
MSYMISPRDCKLIRDGTCTCIKPHFPRIGLITASVNTTVSLPMSGSQSLQTEIDNHEPRIHSLLETGQGLVSEGHPQSEEFIALMDDLDRRWHDLKQALEDRKERLQLSDTAQQVGAFICVYFV